MLFKKIYQCLIGTCIIVGSCSNEDVKSGANFDNQVQSDLCSDIYVRVEVVERDASGKYIKSELWDEYDPNGGLRPIPDTIFICTNLKNAAFQFGDLGISDFKIGSSIRLKLGQTTDCRQPANFILTDATPIFKEQLITHKDFFMGGVVSDNAYRDIELIHKVPIRQMLNEIMAIPGPPYLNQLIITTSLNSSGKHCNLEYIHFACEKTH